MHFQKYKKVPFPEIYQKYFFRKYKKFINSGVFLFFEFWA